MKALAKTPSEYAAELVAWFTRFMSLTLPVDSLFFLRWDCESARCDSPVGFPRLIEHFWKWRLRMSLREKVSLHKRHWYGRSPVSAYQSASTLRSSCNAPIM